MQHFQHPSDEEDRPNRFLSPNGSEGLSIPIRERATSQPPRISDPSFLSSSVQQSILASSFAGGSNWSTQRLLSPNRSTIPQSIPTRSSSFSTHFGSTMRDRSFSSTYEDDEYEGGSDTYDERFIPTSLSPSARGRTYNQDLSRSRSQSLATGRAGAIGTPFPTSTGWNEPTVSNPLNIPGSRYGDIKPPGSSRYGSLGALGRSPNISHSPSGVNGFSNRQGNISNISPFVRDVGHMVLDDGSAFRELWSGMNEEGGGSGNTSRRHSVSVVQPRRGTVVGFNAPSADIREDSSRPVFSQVDYGRGGGSLVLSDEDLAGDLSRLNLEPSSSLPISQPSSLPIYAPLSRSPPSKDLMSSYNPMNLNIPTGTSYSSRPSINSPSESGLSGGSPTRSAQFEKRQQPELTARFIPGQGIQYLPPISTSNLNGNGNSYTRTRAPSYTGSISSPLTPNSSRSLQQSYFSPMQRRPSDTPQPLSELGKGVPLHSVPASWPLFIVEFKAGRTDLFYLTDLSQDIRVGDLVIVEADRGKDLGKVINDSITLVEVEAFQKQQQERAGFGNGPGSPGGGNTVSTPTTKKEINPKMIYGKALQQDVQLLVNKIQDEVKALQLCQSKVRAKKLPMEVVDAEYQWDRRKLTFYFVAEKRIDFRELVRELFRLYKTRIWMASLQGGGGYEQ